MKRVSSGFAWFMVLAIPVALALPSAAHADSVLSAYPAEIVVAAAGGTTICCYTPGTVSGNEANSAPGGGGAFSTATASYADGGGAVSGNGYSSGGPYSPVSSGDASVTIYFEVVGPASDVPNVPIIFTGTAVTSVNSDTDASASAIFQLYYYFDDTACSGYGCDSSLWPSSFTSLQTEEYLYPNTVYAPSIGIVGDAGEGDGTWYASLDPLIEIDPTFPDASDYSLEFSPNPSGTSTVTPEPGTLTLFGSGLFVLAGAVRRRMRK
ncbi:MAG: PEP-CTERM sorting domain-containing protein [Terracidiphilus sp.]